MSRPSGTSSFYSTGESLALTGYPDTGQYREGEKDREKERQTGRETDGDEDRDKNRQTERQKYRQRERPRERNKERQRQHRISSYWIMLRVKEVYRENETDRQRDDI